MAIQYNVCGMNAMVCLLAPHPVWSPQQMDAMLIGVRLMGMQLLSSSELNPSSPLLFPSHVHPFWATCGSQPPSQPWSLTLPSKSVLFRTQCNMNTERWRIGLHALPVGRQQIVLLSLSLSLCMVQNLFFGLSCLPFFPPSTLFILSSTPPSVFLPLSYPSGRNEAIVVCSEGMQFELFSLGILELG